MSAPTEAELRRALDARINHPTDHLARDMDWVSYLSDALRSDSIWARGRSDDGDLLAGDVELEDALDAAEERIRRVCMAVAIEEFVAAGLAFAARRPDFPRSRGEVTRRATAVA